MKKLILICGLALAGCGGGGGNAISCTSGGGDGGAAMSCTDISSTGGGTPSCGTSGTVVSACATANQVGRCTFTATGGGASVTTVTHFYAPSTAADAMTACSFIGGTFTAG